MRRAIVAVALGAALLAGCIRQSFDLCAEEPPHPDCALDAGDDAGGGEDAGDDAGHDAGDDAGHDAGDDAGHDAGDDAG
ncbi:MAG: hypothetical protein KF729_00615 [Sandaracinaceae bacterium]|nr:hypothetical protein [Sandaracinaceae bacterium]